MRLLALIAPPFLAASLLAAQSPDTSATRNLMPVPASIRFGPGSFRIDSTFSIAAAHFIDGRLRRGIERMRVRLQQRAGVPIVDTLSRRLNAASLVVDVAGAGERVQSPAENESYTLDVSGGGAVLRARTVVGALRGLETLLQLVELDPGGAALPYAHIADAPRFPWRGLLIDVSRHWEPVGVIERNLDAMAAVKLNVLHWHLSDDQGFRVESKLYPKLQEMGSHGHYYTQTDIRHIVEYARDRGIRVVPEFDMPGHSASWFVGYPRLASAPGPYTLEERFGVFDPVFDPTRESVYRFLDRFVGEMVKLFPDRYWHVGGDEVNGHQWKDSPHIRAFMRRHKLKDNDALQVYFNKRLARILEQHHRRMVGWDEIMTPGLPKTVIVQSWRGVQSLAEGAKQGYQGILSAPYYLDAMRSAGEYYSADPLPADAGLDADQVSRILGGEVCMWGELVTPENIDSRIWPRTAAIAERLWSPQHVTDVDDMYRRLAVTNVALEQLGVEQLAGPEKMLRRLANTPDDEVLRDLARLVEPVSLGGHMRGRRTSPLTPLTALGDIVTPDAPERRVLRTQVLGLLQDTPSYQADREALEQTFARWRALPARLDSLAASAPLVHDADSASANLAALGVVGEQALGYLAGGTPAPPQWTSETLALLERADRPAALLHLAVVPAMRTLVTAAGRGGLGTQ